MFFTKIFFWKITVSICEKCLKEDCFQNIRTYFLTPFNTDTMESRYTGQVGPKKIGSYVE